MSLFVFSTLLLLTACGQSKYAQCLDQAKQSTANLNTCTQNRLRAAGYMDGIDCIDNYATPTCSNKTHSGSLRYAAEAEDSNACMTELHIDEYTPNVVNCQQYLNQ